MVHVGVVDPPKLTQEMNDEDEKLGVYRRVRDEIKDMVLNIEKTFEGKNGSI